MSIVDSTSSYNTSSLGSLQENKLNLLFQLEISCLFLSFCVVIIHLIVTQSQALEENGPGCIFKQMLQ